MGDYAQQFAAYQQHLKDEQKRLEQEARLEHKQFLAQMQSNLGIAGLLGAAGAGANPFQLPGNPWSQLFPAPPAGPVVPPPRIDRSRIDRSRIEALKSVEARRALPRIPDCIEPITAWRVWAYNSKGLGSVGVDAVWPARKPMVAKCEGGMGGEAPEMNCSCGIWSFKDLDTLLPAADSYATRDTKLIVGSVYLWGRVIECENGYRAQYAYPKELWCLTPEHEELGVIYNVPVRV